MTHQEPPASVCRMHGGPQDAAQSGELSRWPRDPADADSRGTAIGRGESGRPPCRGSARGGTRWKSHGRAIGEASGSPIGECPADTGAGGGEVPQDTRSSGGDAPTDQGRAAAVGRRRDARRPPASRRGSSAVGERPDRGPQLRRLVMAVVEDELPVRAGIRLLKPSESSGDADIGRRSDDIGRGPGRIGDRCDQPRAAGGRAHLDQPAEVSLERAENGLLPVEQRPSDSGEWRSRWPSARNRPSARCWTGEAPGSMASSAQTIIGSTSAPGTTA